MPYVISDIIQEKKANVKVIETKATWLGVTYKEDKDYFIRSFTKENVIRTIDEHGTFTLTYRLMMDGTPVYDIKPYLPHIDSIPDATGGFSTQIEDYTKDVVIPKELEEKLPLTLRPCLKEALAQDPRPSYIDDSQRIYGFYFDKFEVKFKVEGKTLTVVEIIEQ